jgi:hypothetical protein
MLTLSIGYEYSTGKRKESGKGKGLHRSMIDIAVIRQKLMKQSDNIPREAPKTETCPVAQPTVETGPTLTEQIKVAHSLLPGAGRYTVAIEAIVANLEKLKMLAEVSEEMKNSKPKTKETK